ncbi:hypothetical protein [Vulgatibacter incomptus]|nr:hypothetical protein [Vulgatibacter incomptus]
MSHRSGRRNSAETLTVVPLTLMPTPAAGPLSQSSAQLQPLPLHFAT